MIAQSLFVPRTGLEPAHLAAPPPEDGASTNFATWAFQDSGGVQSIFGASTIPIAIGIATWAPLGVQIYWIKANQ